MGPLSDNQRGELLGVIHEKREQWPMQGQKLQEDYNMDLLDTNAKLETMERNIKKEIDKTYKVKEVAKTFFFLVVIGGVLGGSWTLLGPAATLGIALVILFVGYRAWKREAQNKLLEEI